MTDVVWSLYASRRAIRTLEDKTYYFGYIKVGIDMCPYLPKRVLSQFGYYKGFLFCHSPSYMRIIVNRGTSRIKIWCRWLRLCHMGPHTPTLWTTCLGIMSNIHNHMWFRQWEERYHVVLYVFRNSPSHNLSLSLSHH